MANRYKVISGDALLYAVGRQGNVDDLNLAAAGLEADSRGRIAVDSEYRTKVRNICPRNPAFTAWWIGAAS